MIKPKIVCVVVTYNRLEKLKRTLASYEAQTEKFYKLVIVDNHSTDGTQEYLASWKETSIGGGIESPHVITMNENKGGSGGFYEGQKYAMSLNPDWIFVADDDAYPEANMIKKFTLLLNQLDYQNLSAICVRVEFSDGTIQLDHRSRKVIYHYTHFGINPVSKDEYTRDYFEIDFFSYVGTFLNCKKLLDVGLVNRKYFIYFDDTEHSLRLKSVGAIICVPSIHIIHDVGMIVDKDTDIVSWRDYYHYRNQIDMIRKHAPICVPEMLYVFFRQSINSSKERMIMVLVALRDGLIGKLEINKKYRPGCKLK